MRNSTFVLVLIALLTAGCNLEDNIVSYSQSDFYGQWQLSNSTSVDFQQCPDSIPLLEISDSELITPITNGEGCMTGTFPTDYTFDGDKFSLSILGENVDYKIIAYSNAEFTWEDNIEENQETFVRVQ